MTECWFCYADGRRITLAYVPLPEPEYATVYGLYFRWDAAKGYYAQIDGPPEVFTVTVHVPKEKWPEG